MRVWHLGMLGVVVLALALTGCGQPTTGGGTPTTGGGGGSGADKLHDAVIGKWEGKVDDKTATYDFKKDGKFEFDRDKLTVKGDWKAADDKHLELKYTLGEDQVEDAKKVWKEPEQKKGDITNKMKAEVKDGELKIGGETFKKK
jgi:hypothetical protein